MNSIRNINLNNIQNEKKLLLVRIRKIEELSGMFFFKRNRIFSKVSGREAQEIFFATELF